MGKNREATWQLLFPDKFNVDAFEDLFLAELDSWFTADIACCEACYDSFAEMWPGIARSPAFENTLMDLRVFRSGSGLANHYTEEEYLQMCRKMGCPVCGEALEDRFWPYQSNFDVPRGFEAETAELQAIAYRTPFLVLRHPLALRTFEEVKRLAGEVDPRVLDGTYYRARPIGTPDVVAQFFPLLDMFVMREDTTMQDAPCSTSQAARR